MSRSKLLAEITDNTRDLAYFYLSKLDEKDWFIEPEANGKKINSVAWTLCHMTWAQNHLILKGCSDQAVSNSWLDMFAIGSTPPPFEKYPVLDEIKNEMKTIHQKSIEVLSNMDDDELMKPNNTSIKFKRGDAKLQIINHHIRHEAMHIGHLSILCKLLDAKTI